MREGHTVLVVDDEAPIRLLCKVNLELEGYRVLEAATLGEARGQLEAERPDVVLLDVHVAGQDGRELLRELRAQGPGGPAVAFLTGSVELDQAEGADAVLTKPFDLRDLLQTVRRLALGAAITR